MEDKHISQFWLLLRKNLSDFVCLGVIRADPKRLLEFFTVSLLPLIFLYSRLGCESHPGRSIGFLSV